MSAAVDIARLQSWIGRQETREDTVTPVPVAALAATLDLAVPPARIGDGLPPLWHWLYFLPLHRRSELGPDGHAKRGGFLPPVPLPRRMWAGGRLEFLAPLRVGETIRRVSSVMNVTEKRGRSGSLVFVVVRHEIVGPQGLALTEEHDIVYREGGALSTSRPGTALPADPLWARQIVADDVLLFRYSALTFNGHRIHYDRRYATETEGYPGLIVHGPLIATLLAGLAAEAMPEATMSTFEFRAVAPVFDTGPFRIAGRPDGAPERLLLWAETAEGHLAMEARATMVTPPTRPSCG